MINYAVTIVMTTYNGEDYLLQQMLSIMKQSRPADEVLIFDDASSDATVSMIEDFIKKNNLKNWKLNVNKYNVGWRKNFIQGILKAKGDVIFLSDQDDIWDCEKISEMVNVMNENKDIQVLACNITVRYDDDTQPKIKGAAKNYGINVLEKVELNGKTYRPLRPGCAYAFRKEILSEIERLWFEGLAHDSLIWSIGLMKERLYILNKTLMCQVRHIGNNTPVNEKKREFRKENIRSRKRLSLHLIKHMDNISDKNRRWLKEYVNAANYRIEFMTFGGICRFVGLFKYRKYYPKIASVLGDYIAYINGD